MTTDSYNTLNLLAYLIFCKISNDHIIKHDYYKGQWDYYKGKWPPASAS